MIVRVQARRGKLSSSIIFYVCSSQDSNGIHWNMERWKKEGNARQKYHTRCENERVTRWCSCKMWEIYQVSIRKESTYIHTKNLQKKMKKRRQRRKWRRRRRIWHSHSKGKTEWNEWELRVWIGWLYAIGFYIAQPLSIIESETKTLFVYFTFECISIHVRTSFYVIETEPFVVCYVMLLLFLLLLLLCVFFFFLFVLIL